MKQDVTAALLYALKAGPLGRRSLVARSGVGESTVRTHLNHMRSRGWVAFAKAGTSLTPKGQKRFAGLLNAVQAVCPVQLDGLDLLSSQMAVHLRQVELPKPVWSLRDRAIRAGAGGALLLEVEERLVFAEVDEPLGKTNPQAEATLKRAFSPLSQGDVVLIAFADSTSLATRGVWHMVTGMVPLVTEDRDLGSNVHK